MRLSHQTKPSQTSLGLGVGRGHRHSRYPMSKLIGFPAFSRCICAIAGHLGANMFKHSSLLRNNIDYVYDNLLDAYRVRPLSPFRKNESSLSCW